MTLPRSVGLGLAARGEVAKVVRWAERARAAGLDAVWFHDSYFERDAVTYASAVASAVPDIGIGLGALNPYTRHPVLIAMTVSAIDEMAPGRVRLALGSALPLRLAQMGIPYKPDEAPERVERCIETVRTLWRGERIPAPVPNLPPLQPMFAPVHRVPIYIAGYRTPMMKLAGKVADGYLARPAESIPGLRRLLGVMRRAAAKAGREPNALTASGYLLTLVDKTRRAALDRAKREPFVIYMMSILSDPTLKYAGFDPALRDRIAPLWRAEKYTEAGALIPDELVDAFLVCGGIDEVASRVQEYRDAGMDVPLVQPIVQDDDQVELCIRAAVAYGEGRVRSTQRVALRSQRLGAGERVLRGFRAATEIARPFSFTASIVPVAAGGALAAIDGAFSWPIFLAALVGGVALHIGTNVVNEIYDVRKGVDTITSPRASHALVTGRITERAAFALAFAAFAVAFVVGIGLAIERGWPVVALGLLGLISGYTYTAPPFEYKFKALGLPLVFLQMGVLMTCGAQYVVAGFFDPRALLLSIPVGLLVTAILHGNEWRDISEDARLGGTTIAIQIGRVSSHMVYVGLVVAAYMVLALTVVVGTLPPSLLLATLSLPFLVRVLRASELGVAGDQRAIAMIDLQTAQLHAAFGALLVLGLVLAAIRP